MTDEREIELYLQEKASRKALRAKTLDIEALSFPKQAAFILDPSKRKAAICSRRAGKTYATILMLIKAALEQPGSQSVFISYTRSTAKNTIWKPLQEFLRKLGIVPTVNKTDLALTLPNGSTIRLQGASKEEDAEKLRGNPYAIVVLDECGSAEYAHNLDYIVKDLLGISVDETRGTLVMIGTPDIYIDTLFYRVTGLSPGDQDYEPGWSVHRWTWEDNDSLRPNSKERVSHNIRLSLQERLKADPELPLTDGYKREYRGDWILASDQLVYRFNPAKNLTPELPPGPYETIISVDPASNDGTAFVVASFQKGGALYIRESYKLKQLDITQVAEHVKDLAERYKPITRYVIDGAAKQAVSEMRSRHKIPWIPTTKSPNYKHNAISQMNGDFRLSKIKILAHKNQELLKEYARLTWDPKDPTKERQSLPNDLCDAALYAYLQSKHWLNAPPPPPSQSEHDLPRSRQNPFAYQEENTIIDYLDILTDWNKP